MVKRDMEKELERCFRENLGVKVQRAIIIDMEERKMIWAKMEKQEDKGKVMQIKSKLGNEQIYIDHDRSKEEGTVQKKIVKLARKEKKQGKEVKLKFWKISINGKWFR